MRYFGFTLIDLMIAVAIIGILATIAIPAFAKYSSESKKVEGRINLELIGKGAVAFFAEEHTYSNGMKVRTHEYPSISNWERAANYPGIANKSLQPIGGMPYQSYNQKDDRSKWNDGVTQVGIKHDPRLFEEQFNSFPWVDLKFRINTPFYFSYNYEGKVLGQCTESDCKNGTTNKMSFFAATASACLLHPCRVSGKYVSQGQKTDCDSGYVIVGGPHGTLGPLMDNSDFTIATSCGKALTSEIGKKVNFSKY